MKIQISNNPRAQWAILTLISFLFVAVRLSQTGTNIVTGTYEAGALRLFHHDNPYRLPLEGGDRFEYSPLFAMLYGPLAFLGGRTEALLWALLNAAIFWKGILAWRTIDRRNWKQLFPLFLLCSMELNISLLYQQTNALLIGIVLIAFALLRDGKDFSAAFWMTVATNWKPLPALSVFPLIPFQRLPFWNGLFTATIACLFLPALVVGFGSNFAIHQSWIDAVFASVGDVRVQQLDVESVLGRFSLSSLGHGLRLAIAGIGIGLSLFWLYRKRNHFSLYLVVTIATLMLVNPRSESPTFVFLAPAYVLILSSLRTRGEIGLLYLAGFFMTLLYTDLWPKPWLLPLRDEGLSKTIGAMVLWSLAIYAMVRELRNTKQDETLCSEK